MDRSDDDSNAFEEDSGSEWYTSDQESSDSSDYSETSGTESDDEGAKIKIKKNVFEIKFLHLFPVFVQFFVLFLP